MRDDERPLLQPWLDAFQRCFGQTPLVRPMDVPAGAPPGTPTDLYTITFPVDFKPPEILGGKGHFAHQPACAAHMRALGYAWNDAGRIVTTPTPSTLNALLDALAPAAGFRVEFFVEDARIVPIGPWLVRYMEGRLPIHVCTANYYTTATDEGGTPLQDRHFDWHLTLVAHDLTVHALNYHLVPREGLARLSARIRDAMPGEYAAWSAPGAPGPLTLSYFFDNDFNRYAYSVWSRTERPEQFAEVFLAPSNFDQILAVLDQRLDETRAGKGDVASGVTGDMARLEQREFRIQGRR